MANEGRKIIFGTMRLLEQGRSVDNWVEFFEGLYSIGIDTLHSSSEYQSFPLLCDILARLSQERPDIRFNHMVKLAEPSFDDRVFNPARFDDKIALYQTALRTSTIDIVQWMWRYNLSNDLNRLTQFKDAESMIFELISKHKKLSNISCFACFPYSNLFARYAVISPVIDKLVVYRNIQETEYDIEIDQCLAVNKNCIIIRPFNGGLTFNDHNIRIEDIFKCAMDMPAIKAVVVSSSNLDHVRSLMTVLA